METCLGIEPSLFSFADRIAPQCCTSLSRSERRESNPHGKTWQIFALPIGLVRKRRAGTEIRTRLVRLGRPTSRLEKYPQLPRPAARLSHFSGRPYSRRPGSAFGIAGGDVGSRTLRVFLQGRAASRRTSPLVGFRCETSPQLTRHGASESNAVLRIWNPIGHHGLHRVAPRTRIELVSLLRQRNCDTSRITRLRASSALGRGRTFEASFRKRCAGSAGERLG